MKRRRQGKNNGSARIFAGTILVILGIIFLLQNTSHGSMGLPVAIYYYRRRHLSPCKVMICSKEKAHLQLSSEPYLYWSAWCLFLNNAESSIYHSSGLFCRILASGAYHGGISDLYRRGVWGRDTLITLHSWYSIVSELLDGLWILETFIWNSTAPQDLATSLR